MREDAGWLPLASCREWDSLFASAYAEVQIRGHCSLASHRAQYDSPNKKRWRHTLLPSSTLGRTEQCFLEPLHAKRHKQQNLGTHEYRLPNTPHLASRYNLGPFQILIFLIISKNASLRAGAPDVGLTSKTYFS